MTGKAFFCWRFQVLTELLNFFVMDNLPAQYRAEDLRFQDFRRLALQKVIGKDYHIGIFSHFERTFYILFMGSKRGTFRVTSYSLGNR